MEKTKIQKKVDKIVDKLYKAYGTDTGILFGVSDRNVVAEIVKFAVQETLWDKE